MTSHHLQLSDGQEFTVIAGAAQRRSAAERSTTTGAVGMPTAPALRERFRLHARERISNRGERQQHYDLAAYETGGSRW